MVVIAVIAVLVGILLPALGHARETARVTVCLSNLRSQGQAIGSYTLENDDSTPPRLVWISEPNDHGGIELTRFLINRFMADWLNDPFPPDDSGDLYPPTGMWRCPEISPEDEGLRLTHMGYIHHAPNQFLFGILDYESPGAIPSAYMDAAPGWQTTGYGSRWGKYTMPQHPAEVIAVMDNVQSYFISHMHWDAREFYGRSVHVASRPTTAPDVENNGSHSKVGVRPTVFVSMDTRRRCRTLLRTGSLSPPTTTGRTDGSRSRCLSRRFGTLCTT